MRRGCKPHNPLSDRYMFEDAAGRPPDGEYLHTISFWSGRLQNQQVAFKGDLSVRLSTPRTRCRKNPPQNILNRVGSGNINPAEDFRSVFVRKQ
jgi:hypothetical protein